MEVETFLCKTYEGLSTQDTIETIWSETSGHPWSSLDLFSQPWWRHFEILLHPSVAYFRSFSFDLIWFDSIWFDSIWFDLIWFDLIWFSCRQNPNVNGTHCFNSFAQKVFEKRRPGWMLEPKWLRSQKYIICFAGMDQITNVHVIDSNISAFIVLCLFLFRINPNMRFKSF